MLCRATAGSGARKRVAAAGFALVHVSLAAADSALPGQAAHCSVGPVSQQSIVEALRADSTGPQQGPAEGKAPPSASAAAIHTAAEACGARRLLFLATFKAILAYLADPAIP